MSISICSGVDSISIVCGQKSSSSGGTVSSLSHRISCDASRRIASRIAGSSAQLSKLISFIINQLCVLFPITSFTSSNWCLYTTRHTFLTGSSGNTLVQIVIHSPIGSTNFTNPSTPSNSTWVPTGNIGSSFGVTFSGDWLIMNDKKFSVRVQFVSNVLC